MGPGSKVYWRLPCAGTTGVPSSSEPSTSDETNCPCQWTSSGMSVSLCTSTVTRLPSRKRKMGPGTLPLYPTVLITLPGAISTLTCAMRSVTSGFASGSAATEENRGTEAKAAPTALTPVTARNSLRSSMVDVVSFGTNRMEKIVKRHNPIALQMCQAGILQTQSTTHAACRCNDSDTI